MDASPPFNIVQSLPAVPLTLDRKFAKIVSNGLNPILLSIISAALVAGWLHDQNAWLWAGFQVVFGLIIPVAFIGWLLRRKMISDFDVYHRQQRFWPYVVTISCGIFSLLVMWLGQAPRLLVAMSAAVLCQAVIMFLINLRWKISAHAAGMTAFVMVILFLAGNSGLPILAGIPLMMWSRVRLRRHTLMQTVAGSILSALVFGGFLYFSAG